MRFSFPYRRRFLPWLCAIFLFEYSALQLTAQTPEMDEEGRIFFRAKNAYDDTLYPEVQKQLQGLLENHPRTRFKCEAYLLLGQCALVRNEQERAQVDFRRILRAPENPFQERALFYLGQSYYDSQRYAQAVKALGQLLKQYPLTGYAGVARLIQAKVWERTGHCKKAMQELAKIAADYPGKEVAGWAWVEKAKWHQSRSEIQQAVDTLSALASSGVNPLHTGQLELWRAVCLTHTGRYSDALPLYDKAAEKESSHSTQEKGMLGKAMAQKLSGDRSGAKSTCRDFLAKFPKSRFGLGVQLMLARLALEEGDLEGAEKTLAVLDPGRLGGKNLEDFMLLQAERMLRSKDFTGAAKKYEMFLHRYPDKPATPYARYRVALCLYYQEQYRACVQAVEESLSDSLVHTPGMRARAMMLKADALAGMQQWSDAANAYAHVLQAFAPDRADEILYRMGRCYYQDRQWPQAVTALEQLVEKFPQSPWVADALYRLGALKFQFGEYAKAAGYFHRLGQGFPQSEPADQAAFQEGVCWYRLGQFDSAKQAYETLLKTFPKGERKQDAMIELAWTLARSGKDQDAADAFTAFVKQFPQSPRAPEAWFWLGQDRLSQNDFAQSYEFFGKLLENQPKSDLADDARFCAAIALARWGRHDDSNGFLQKLLASHPPPDLQADALFLMADNEAAEKRYGRAIALFSKIWAGDTAGNAKRDAAGLRIADCSFAQGNFAQSLTWYTKLQDAADPSLQGQARFKKAIAQEALENWEGAKSELMDLIYAQALPKPWPQKAVLKLGEILQREDRHAEALVLYEKLAKQAGEEAQIARDRMDSIRAIGRGLGGKS